MIAVDTNILVYAHRRDSAWHAQARDRVGRLAEGRDSWLIPWPCVHEFLAIVTHPRIYVPPSSIEAAVRQVDYWIESPSLLLEGEAGDHWKTLRESILRGKVAGPMIHDARVAAICLTCGVDTLWSADRDFSRFPELHVVNPLLAA